MRWMFQQCFYRKSRLTILGMVRSCHPRYQQRSGERVGPWYWLQRLPGQWEESHRGDMLRMCIGDQSGRMLALQRDERAGFTEC